MPRPGTAARRRAREGLPDVHPGKVSWVFGTKEIFFGNRKDQWMEAVELKKQTKFYDKMTRMYILKYGYNLGWNDDIEVDVSDPEDGSIREVARAARREELKRRRREEAEDLGQEIPADEEEEAHGEGAADDSSEDDEEEGRSEEEKEIAEAQNNYFKELRTVSTGILVVDIECLQCRICRKLGRGTGIGLKVCSRKTKHRSTSSSMWV